MAWVWTTETDTIFKVWDDGRLVCACLNKNDARMIVSAVNHALFGTCQVRGYEAEGHAWREPEVKDRNPSDNI